MSELVKCKGGCGTDVAKGKFGELCKNCWYKQKKVCTASHAVKREHDKNHWHPAQTMCLFCHEQTRSIRGMKLHYHTTDHLGLYQELTEEQKNEKRKEREQKLSQDPFEGAEKTPWF